MVHCNYPCRFSRLLPLVVFIILLRCPVFGQVVFCDHFEKGSVQWPILGNMILTTAHAHTGTSSQTYTAVAAEGDGRSITFPVSPNVTYYFHVAYMTLGGGGWVGLDQFDDQMKPQGIKWLVGDGGAAHTPFAWDYNVNVQNPSDLGVWKLYTTTYTVPSNTYFVRVHTEDWSGGLPNNPAAGGVFYDDIELSESATPKASQPVLTPTDLQVVYATPTRVTLNWTDNSSNETTFILEMQSGGNWTEAAILPYNTTQTVIRNLQPQTLYSFRLRAINFISTSEYSNVAQVTTPVLEAPTELTAEAISFEDVLLRWKDNTLYETHYVIEYRIGAGAWNVRDTVPAGSNEFLVGNLSASTSYSFRVKAIEATVSSAYSNIADAKTKLFLHAPINLNVTVLSRTEVRLNWEDRSIDESGFEIERRLQGEEWSLAHLTQANAVTHQFSQLYPDTTYSFRVRAVGTDAASAWSNEVTIGTFSLPSAPVGLVASAVSHTAVQIDWERGSNNEMLFEIERNVAGGAWTPLSITGRGEMHLRDDGLDPVTTYTYRVRAVNSLGASSWSSEDTATTYPLPLPGTPIGLTASATGPTSVVLAWIATSPQYQTGFEIQESLTDNESDFLRLSPDAAGNAKSYTRAGLSPKTTYYYRIRAVNQSGTSQWSKIVSVTTQEQDVKLPGDPFAAQATALSKSSIRITWDMPTPSKEDGFEIEQSPTGNAGDFTRIDPNPVQGVREHTATGLQPNTTYWYRVRAYNAYGYSQYSNVASATTEREPLSQALSTAMQAKEALFPSLENLIGAGDAEMAALRGIFGDYARGYDEAPARALIGAWRTVYPNEQARAAEALERFVYFEEALGSGFKDKQFTPPIDGAWEISRQAAGAPGVLTKDVCALALAWTAQSAAMGKEHPYVNAAMADLLLPLTDVTQNLLSLMGANIDDALPRFTEEVLRLRGAVPGLNARSLLSVLNYWQERIAGGFYLPATQPLIADFADRCGQMDIGGSKSSAAGKRDGFTLALRDRTTALSSGYAGFGGICTGLDAAYAIGQTPGQTASIVLQRLVQLRPRLVDGMYAAVSDADIPVERFLYLTAATDIPGLTPLPHALQKTGGAIYHPEIGGAPGIAPPRSGGTEERSTLQHVAIGRVMSASTDPAIESDRAALVVLREKVVAADAAYAAAQFDALRASGGGMTAAVTRAERPLFGIAPAEMYQQTALREHYYGTLARSTLLKTRRSVLSVSLADYALAPTAQKQAALVAEIDSILGPLDGVITGLEDLKSGQAGSLITLPVLSLGDAELVRNEAAGPTKFRLRFAVANVGGAAAAQPQAAITLLTAGVTASGATAFTFGDLAVAASAGDSLELDIPANIPAIGISASLQSGGRVFTDRRTLAVPQSTTGTDADAPLPASVLLHQNHPNPFRPVTTISFTLPHETAVTLIVTDMLGREVARLVDGERRGAGTHRVGFDARELPSGMYLYRLESEGAAVVRKMVLMR